MRTIERGEYNSIAPHGASSMMAAARQSQHASEEDDPARVGG